MTEQIYHTKDLSKYNFLVTGGAGFIGSHLTEYLLKNNANHVTVLDNLSTGFMENIDLFSEHPNFTFINGDITNLLDCKNAIENVDYIFHEAALGSVPRSIEDPITTNKNNIDGFLNVLVAIKESDKKPKMVYAASSSTYGDSKILPKKEEVIGNPISPYAVTKYVNELYADVFSKTYNLKLVGLRYFNVFGPRQNPNGGYAAVIPKFIQKALNDDIITINGDGEHSRDFTYIENVIQANIKAAFVDSKEGHSVYNTACGSSTTLNNLVDIISENFKNVIKIKYGSERQGDIKDSLADINKISNELKYNPKFQFKEGMKITFNWFKNNPSN